MQETPVRFLVAKIPWRRVRLPTPVFLGFPGDSVGKKSTCSVGDLDSIPGLGGSPPWRSAWQPTPLFLPREFPWTEEPGRLQSITGSQESDTTEPLSAAQLFYILEVIMTHELITIKTVTWNFLPRL